MAWPYDQGGYQTPQLSAMMLGNLGGAGALSSFGSDAGSGAQNIASLFQAGQTGGAGASAGGAGGIFDSLSNVWNGDGFLGKNSVLGGVDTKSGMKTAGWAPLALGLGQAIYGGIQGQRTQKLAENQFKEGKRQFDLNYNAQRDTINTNLEDRQRARVASNPGAYQSVSEYLDKNRIK